MSVYLLDDDSGVQSAIGFAFRTTGLKLEAYATPSQLLSEISHDEPSCLILDLQLKGTTGTKCLNDPDFAIKVDMPVIVLTGTAEVSDVVETMKLGVIDFLEKPVEFSVLLDSVQVALKEDASRMGRIRESAQITELSKTITEREREVVALICEGYSSKQIATKLGISMNTVANHRARLRQKTGAANTAELIRLVVLADSVRKQAAA